MKPKYHAALVFLAVLVIYLLTLSENLAIGHDSSMYINWIEKSQFLFMPHHLLYTITMRLWLSFCELLMPGGNDAVFVTVPNAIAGAFCAAMIFVILTKNAGVRTGVALAATAGAAFSFGFWFYSVAIEVYLIPLALLLVAFYLVTKPELSRSDIWKIGIVHALGILYHQAHVLMYVALAGALMYRSSTIGLSRVRVLLRYTLWSAVPTIAVYLAVMVWYVNARTVQEGYFWLTLYSHELSASWNPVALSSLFEACIGFGRAFIGAHFIFAVPAVRSAVTSALKGKWFDDEIFLVQGLSEDTSILLIILSAVFFLLLVYLLVRVIVGKGLKASPRIVLPALLWLIAYSIFFFFWDATNCEFWIPQTVCVWMLLGVGINRLHSKHLTTMLGIAAGVIAVVNFAGSIRFAQSKEYDYYYHRVEPFLNSSDSDLVVMSNSWTIRKYFDYYSEASVLSVQDLLDSARKHELGNPVTFATQAVRSELDSVSRSGGSVYVMADAVKFSEVALMQAAVSQVQVDSIWLDRLPCLMPRTIGIDTMYLYKCP